MEQMEYILIDENNRVASIVHVPVGDNHYMDFNSDEYELIVTDSSGIDINTNWVDWIYNKESNTFEYDPIIEKYEYTDLSTGKKVSITEDEFNNLVDEKVRNNVMAILQELADKDAASIQKILNI